MRWTTADESDAGTLFAAADLVGPQPGSGRLSDLEVMPVLAHRMLNRMPGGTRLPFRWTINPYRGCSHACTYCFARPTHEYLGLNGGDDFDRRIVVKINAVERLRADLAAPGWQREPVAMGTNTDPYQRLEGKYRLMRGIVTELARSGTPFSILTKSGLVTRDLDVLAAAAQEVEVRLMFSIGTLDQDVWRASEPGTPDPRTRLRALEAAVRAGLRTGVLIAPVPPGLSDRRDQLEAVVRAVQAAGSTVTGARPLYLKGATRTHFLSWLAGYDADLHARYLAAYRDRIELPDDYGDWVHDAVERAKIVTNTDTRNKKGGSLRGPSP